MRLKRNGILTIVLAMVILAGIARVAAAAPAVEPNPENDVCFSCHSRPGLTMNRDGQEISVFVDPEVYNATPHAQIACVRCHEEISTPSDSGPYPHPEGIPYGREARETVSERCSKCHRGIVQESYQKSFHGSAVMLGSSTAATCIDCHGVHQILPPSDPESTVAEANLPTTCGQCHEGAGPLMAAGTEHFVPAKAGSPWLGYLWKFFIALILFDTLKDGPIVVFELIHRLHRDFRARFAQKGGQ